jgi:hypothetical protein
MCSEKLLETILQLDAKIWKLILQPVFRDVDAIATPILNKELALVAGKIAHLGSI